MDTGKLNLDGMGPISHLLGWALGGEIHMFIFFFALTVGFEEMARVVEWWLFGTPYIRARFAGYLPGELALCVAVAAAVPSVHRFGGSRWFYTQPAWYICLLVMGWVISLGIENYEVWSNDRDPLKGYTIQQELTLSKLAHTFNFGPVLAFLVGLLPILIADGSWLEILLAFAMVLVWAVLNAVVDPKRGSTWLRVMAHPHPSRDKQMKAIGWLPSR